MTIAVDVRRASAEHIRPIVEVAMQVVAMMSKKTISVQKRSRSSGSKT